MPDRYHRQTLLPQIGDAGQARLAEATVAILGCGALGTVAADSLARAGVGRLILIDRDLVEVTNLQRQTLYDEADATDSRPKAVAAAERLQRVNSSISLEPRPVDVDVDNVLALVEEANLIVDGTDNAATRYLLNDAAVKRGKPWIYGAAVGTEGRAMALGRVGFIPPSGESDQSNQRWDKSHPTAEAGPCLRCVFRDPPPPGELETCDTAGILAAASGIVGNLQAALAIRTLVSGDPPRALQAFDVWTGEFRTIDLSSAKDPTCPCCARHEFPFLDQPAGDAVALCGRGAVQLRTPNATWKLDILAAKLRPLGEVSQTPMMLRFTPADRPSIRMTAFRDARVIVQGTTDLSAARSAHARYFGA